MQALLPQSRHAGRALHLAIVWHLLHSSALRPVRFIMTGGTAGALQLVLLVLLTSRGWQPELANVFAFLVAAQLNFALSTTFTWRDRQSVQPIWRRWLAFHGSIAGMAVVNMIVFWLARHCTPPLVASALGICAASLGNYLLGDQLIFHGQASLSRKNNSHSSGQGMAA